MLQIRKSGLFISATVAILALGSCQGNPPAPTDPKAALIAKGEKIFFNETFDGNGRTCGTCHRAEDNFAISPAFIATLPPDDALFVSETNPALAKNFENVALIRERALILENQDGFDDLENNFNMRGVPHTLAQRTSIASPQGPRTGWSGDGSPGDGSLRSFAIGAVIQHFPKTLDRVPGVDFRLPREDELNALEAFQLSLGRQKELQLPLPLKGIVAKRGQEIFLDDGLGKCNICHRNAGANASLGGQDLGNANFDTGVENLPDQPQDLTGEKVPPDDGFGTPGDGTFNTPPLVEAADTGPFFHNNSVDTIEGAVAFYDGEAFNNSAAGQFLAGIDPNGIGIKLDATQIVAVAAFLRDLNALENIRVSIELLSRRTPDSLKRAVFETEDAIEVLRGAGLQPAAVAHLLEAKRLARKAAHSYFFTRKLAKEAIAALVKARAEIVDAS
jgi:mono/diheme cytochrome c family protein